jgi:hypothetical protein
LKIKIKLSSSQTLTKAKLEDLIELASEVNIKAETSSDADSENLQKFTERFSEKISKIRINGSISMQQLEHLVKVMKAHQTLNVTYLRIVEGTAGSQEILNLENFEVTVADFDDGYPTMRKHFTIDFPLMVKFMKKMMKLKSLKITDKINYGQWKFVDIFGGKNLESFESDMCQSSDDKSNAIAAFTSQTNLKTLKMFNFELWDKLIEKITKKLTSLEVVEINICGISKNTIKELAHLKNVTTLELKIHNHDQLKKLAKIKLEKLKNLKIHHHKTQIEAPTIEALAKAFPQLTDIGFCGRLIHEIDAYFTYFNFVESFYVNEINNRKVIDSSMWRSSEFVKTSHENEKLKNITFNVKTFEEENVMKKFNRDFKNLACYYIMPMSESSRCEKSKEAEHDSDLSKSSYTKIKDDKIKTCGMNEDFILCGRMFPLGRKIKVFSGGKKVENREFDVRCYGNKTEMKMRKNKEGSRNILNFDLVSFL